VVSVSTCPQCLPAGAITWLIENGRQLELDLEGGVDASVRCHETYDQIQLRASRVSYSGGPSFPFGEGN